MNNSVGSMSRNHQKVGQMVKGNNRVGSKYQRNIEVCDIDIEFEPTVERKTKKK